MKKYIYLFIYLLWGCSALHSQTVDTILTINGYGRDEPNKLCSDAAGNTYIAGTYMGAKVCMSDTCFNGGGGYSVFLYKLNPKGEVLWGKAVKQGNWSCGMDVDDKDNLWILTGTHQGSFVTKYSPEGVELASVTVSNSYSCYFHELSVDKNDNFYLTGYDVNERSPEKRQNWTLAKYNAKGGQIWKMIDENNPYMSRGQDLMPDADGNILFCGFENTGSYNTQIGFIACVSPQGKLIWRQQSEGGPCSFTAISTDSKNNVVACGRFSNSIKFDPDKAPLLSHAHEDFFVVKYDKKGRLIWNKSGGSTQSEVIYSIAVDAQDKIYTVGCFVNTLTIDSFKISGGGAFDCFMLQFDPKGKIEKLETLVDGADIEYAMNILVNSKQELLIAGYYGNWSQDKAPAPTTYRGKALPPARETDGFLMMRKIEAEAEEAGAEAPE